MILPLNNNFLLFKVQFVENDKPISLTTHIATQNKKQYTKQVFNIKRHLVSFLFSKDTKSFMF